MMKQKEKKKLLSAMGLGLLLIHNNVNIELSRIKEIMSLLSEEFDGDDAKALEYVKKEYDKMLNKVLGDDSIENK